MHLNLRQNPGHGEGFKDVFSGGAGYLLEAFAFDSALPQAKVLPPGLVCFHS